MLKRFALIFGFILFVAACSPAEPATEESTIPPETAETTSVPAEATADTEPSITATPMDVQDAPSIELLGASPDSCTNPEDYGQLLGFAARYANLTTEHFVQVRLLDEEGNELAADDHFGQNKDGEEGYGFYPLAYDVPADSALTAEVRVFLSDSADAPLTSFATLTYNCTTGEVLGSTFEQYAEADAAPE